jgi:hypothetical protein
MLGQTDLTLELLPLRLGGARHAAPDDNINLPHLPFSVRIFPTMITSPGFPRHWCCWGWHLLLIQERFALLHIMSRGAVNLTPLLRVIGTLKRPLLFLLRGLLTVESVVSSVPVIASVSCVDLAIISCVIQESCSGIRSLYAYISDCEQINYHLRLLHGNLINNFDIADPIVKGIDDLDVLDIRDSIPGITETFHIVPETLFMLLPDGL